MAFTTRNEKDCFILTETMTLASGATTAQNSTAFSVANNQDFVVFANTGAVNTTGNLVVNVLGSFDNSTFATIKSSLIANADNAVSAAIYDTSTNGYVPYYKVQLAPASDEQGKSIGIAIVTGKR